MALPTQGQVAIGGLTVNTVPTMHDAPQSVALVLRDDETAVGVVTDLGVVTEAVVQAFSGLDGLVLETNHDAEMLLYGPYPAHLKQAHRRGAGAPVQRPGGGAAPAGGAPGAPAPHLRPPLRAEQHPRAGPGRRWRRSSPRPATRPGLAVAEQDRPGAPVRLGAKKQLGLPLW